jgi:hypothetical protein
MSAIENLQKLYEKKQVEVRQLEMHLKEANAYLQALQDSIKVISRESGGAAGTTGTGESWEPQQTLRPGSETAKARDALKLAGKPLHISALLQQLGRPVDKKNRASLSGSLAAYVRTGQIFTRPAPNTFGLVEFGQDRPSTDKKLPETFGTTQ